MTSATGQYSGGSGQGFNANSAAAINLTINNSMFSGGTDDGHTASTSLAISLTISNSQYSGGSDDGTSSADAINTSLITNTLYSGGADDGISAATAALLSLTTNTMFSGGTDDGFTMNSVSALPFGAATNYSGGADDGSSVATQAAIDLTVSGMYAGGNDDGLSVLTVTAVNLSVSSMYSGGGNDGFSTFSTTQILILPVNWLGFTVTGTGEKALLNWKVNQELHNEGYDIERSYDGIHFVKIGFVQAFSSNNSTQVYNYTDVDPAGSCSTGNCNNIFYRLVQKDLDHLHYTYSPIRKLSLNTNLSKADVYPNPATAALNIRIHPINGSSPLYDVLLYNNAGVMVFQRSQLNNNLYQLNVKEYPSGIYFLKLIIDGQTYSYQISILH